MKIESNRTFQNNITDDSKCTNCGGDKRCYDKKNRRPSQMKYDWIDQYPIVED